jgi:hypothetical protein
VIGDAVAKLPVFAEQVAHLVYWSRATGRSS